MARKGATFRIMNPKKTALEELILEDQILWLKNASRIDWKDERIENMHGCIR